MYRTNRLLELPFEASGPGITARVRTTPHAEPARRTLSVPELRTAAFADEPVTESELTAFVETETNASPARVVGRLRETDVLLPADHPQFESGEQWFSHDWRRGLYYHTETHSPADVTVTPARVAAVAAEVRPTERAGVGLPDVDPERVLDEPLQTAMLRRRTHRNFDGGGIDRETLAAVLTGSFDRVRRLRAADPREVDPAAALGAYSFEVYPVVMRSEELAEGVYEYDIETDRLVPLDTTTLTEPAALDTRIRNAAVGQLYVEGAAVTFLFSLCPGRFLRLPETTLRWLYMSMPIHANRLLFVATAAGYRTFMTPASDDELADQTVGLDGYDEAISYILPIGT